MLRPLVDIRITPDNFARTNLLSAREREVAELVAHGNSTRAIAEALFLSERTVESHLSSIFSKLNVHSRVELATAVLRGITETGPITAQTHVPPNNLPIQPTSFRGREHDVEEVKSLLAQHKLVTVSGAGGVGKTRLAVHVAADLLDHYPDGVWFADLAPISDPELVSSIIAKVLGISQQEDRRVDESIPQWLKRKKLLLILDNCEHVLEPAARTGDAVIRSCLEVRLLATSRQALNIAGEVVYGLPPLAMPEKVASLRSETALEYGAIALFVDRAKAADNRFTFIDDSAPVVADICRRLDGIPLAIELAAARVKVLSLPHLSERLNERFNILTSGSRTALPRQKTLSALIDWSYDLLTPQEQTLFNRVSIFAGGFSLEAATAVCSGEGLDEIDILDLLSSLTDKSLVVAETGGEQERYHLLESTRAYGLDKLTAPGQHDRLARRHGEYYRAQAQEADKRFGIGSTFAWLADVELELDNYRAVLEWALTDGHDVALGGAVAGALGRLWYVGGLAVEGRYWIDRAQAGLDESAHPQVAARLWLALSNLSSGNREHDCAERARALYESVGDDYGQACALNALGYSLFRMGRRGEASEAIARALAAMRELEDKAGVADCLNAQSIIQTPSGDVAAARDSYAQALAAYKALGNESGTAVVLRNLAELEFGDGRVAEAMRFVGEALEIHVRGKNAFNLATTYNNIAAYRIALQDLGGAGEAARQGLRWARQAQYALQIAIALQHLALVGALREETLTAVRLIGYVNTQFKELAYEREDTEKWSYDKLMAALREHLSDAEIEKLAAEGAAWSEDQAVEEALKV
jgi:predicted ATPase/DNA-binding CsgD family transcriptional regulator